MTTEGDTRGRGQERTRRGGEKGKKEDESRVCLLLNLPDALLLEVCKGCDPRWQRKFAASCTYLKKCFKDELVKDDNKIKDRVKNHFHEMNTLEIERAKLLECFY